VAARRAFVQLRCAHAAGDAREHHRRFRSSRRETQSSEEKGRSKKLGGETTDHEIPSGAPTICPNERFGNGFSLLFNRVQRTAPTVGINSR